jgi:DnaB-like helicase C terminal domain
MSDIKDDFLKQLGPEDDLNKKEKELKAHNINVRYERFKDNEERHEAIKHTKFGTISDEQAEEIGKESTAYLEKAAKPLSFINEAFFGKVPFFEKNLILVGADSGDGKSTAVANIVFRLVARKDELTGKTRRVLVITNEENIADFYNRLTCLFDGIAYTDHDQFTEAQRNRFAKMIKAWKNRVTIIDDTFNSNGKTVTGATTTPEGIKAIFENLIKDGEYYDAVLIDYYQGVNESSLDMTLDEYKAQRKLTNILEHYRKIYPAPIVLMCQVNRDDPENPTPMKYRIMGTKLVYTRATYVLEMIKHVEELMTEWVIHKGRFAKLGESVKTHFHKGMYIPHTTEFANNLKASRERAADTEFNKTIGIKVGEAEHAKVTEKVSG